MSTKKTSKKKRQFTNRHGIIMIALLAVMILVVNLVMFSYSWFTPASVTGQGLALEETSSLRSERCTFETYPGVLVTESNHSSYSDYYIDQIAYSNSPVPENAVIKVPVATMVDGEKVPGRAYFRTNIQNNDTEYPSVISLYHNQFPNNLGIAVTYPSNTYFFNDTGNYDDCFILRNAYVKVKDDADVDGPGLLQVEWFVENLSTSNTIDIRVSTQTKDGGSFTQDSTIPWLYNQSGGTNRSSNIEWLYLMYN